MCDKVASQLLFALKERRVKEINLVDCNITTHKITKMRNYFKGKNFQSLNLDDNPINLYGLTQRLGGLEGSSISKLSLKSIAGKGKEFESFFCQENVKKLMAKTSLKEIDICDYEGVMQAKTLDRLSKIYPSIK